MKITKNQSLVLAVSIIALFFVVGVWFVPKGQTKLPSTSRELSAPTPAAVATAPSSADLTTTPSAAPDSKFMLKEFHRAEIRDGRKVWEAKGSQGQYLPETNSALITNAELWMYQKDGKVITMTAGEALLHLEGAGLKGADASKGVIIIYNDQEKLETDSLTYDKANNKVSAPGFVKITGELLDISGDGLAGDLETKTFILKQNVSTTLKPKKKKSAT